MVHTETLDKPLVEKLVANWKKRLSDLYATIGTWLDGTEYSLKPSSKQKMYEGPMYYNDVPPTVMESAIIYKGKKPVLIINPRGLWVIGSNGWVEFSTMEGVAHNLVDTADEFEKPNWVLTVNRKGKGIELTKEILLQLIKTTNK